MSVLIFLFVLAILILSHEFGHFIVAKKNGIRVDEFAIGFPPRLFKFKKGETLYSINLIPFGGFVKIHGEEDERDDPRSFSSKSITARASVISAGVFFNLLLAWLLLSGGFMIGMPMSVDSAPAEAEIKGAAVTIIQVQKNTPAEAAGLEAGDKLVDFGSIAAVQEFISENRGKKLEIKYQRGEDVFLSFVTPDANPKPGKGALGIAMDNVGIVNLAPHRAIWEGLKAVYNITVNVSVSFFYFIIDAFRGLAGFDQVMGPVGIVSAAGSFAKLGFGYLLSFIALFSVNLAILNILPFPGLDGGRLLFLAIEKIKGSPVSPKFSSIAHGAGIAILLLLMFVITYKDIMKLM